MKSLLDSYELEIPGKNRDLRIFPEIVKLEIHSASGA